MEPSELINRCREEKRLSLNEAESKEILDHYGLPVVKEMVATSEEEALSMAKTIGYPVVLKGLGSKLTHKTELGLVKIDLHTPDLVRSAFSDIKVAGADAWEGCLLQPMVSGRREFVAGLTRDAQFGPVVMFGLGGIYTEAIGDVVFRIAPIDKPQALNMMEELSTRSLLGPFRGDAAADREALADVLVGLSRLGMEHPDIKEVDINPLIVSADGGVTAVDALVVLNDPEDETLLPALDFEEEQARTARLNAALEVMTHPKAIAVVGVARTQVGGFPGIFRCIRNFGFKGNLYPINPKADEIDGIKAYPTLTALPEPADLVVLSVPGPAVPAALKDCIAAGCKNVHAFTSGFKETGEPEGIRLQAEVKQIIEEGGLNFIGPNCMGIYVPASRVLTWVAAPDRSGPVAMVSQSGGNAQDFTNYAATTYGLYFSKVFSYGNAVTMDSTDFLAYLAGDDETRIVTMYLEGVKNGTKLLELVTDINRTKPVVILKGGVTESGARTVASHTGSMAGGVKIWQAFFHQTGAIQVDSLEEMADVTLALHHLPPCRGRGLAILGNGGGIGVAAADSCAKAGLDMPALTPEVMSQLREIIPPAGNMIRNPIDAILILADLDLLGRTLELLSAQSYIDMFAISLHMDWLFGMEQGEHIMRIGQYIANEARKHLNGKPLAVVWRQYQPNPATKKVRVKLEKTLLDAGVPVFQGLDRAVSAMSKAAGYHLFQADGRNTTG